MEFILLLAALVILKKIFNNILDNYEKIGMEEDDPEQIEEVKLNNLPSVNTKYIHNLSINKNLNGTIIHNSLNKIKEVRQVLSSGLSKVKKQVCQKINNVFNIYEKIDEIATKNKINSKITFICMVFWLILFGILAREISKIIILFKEISIYNILDITIAITSLVITFFIGYFLIKDILGITSLRQTENTKQKIDKYVEEGNYEELENYLLSLKISEIKKSQLKTALQKQNSALDMAIIYERMILQERDNKVHEIICVYRNKVIIGNGVSGSSILDFMVNLYCFYKILLEIARVYKIQLGLISVLRILGTGCLVCYAVSKTTNLLGKVASECIRGAGLLEYSANVLSASVTAVVQAITSGFSMQIYGYWLKYALRPIKSYDQVMKRQTTKVLNSFTLDEQ